MATLYGGQNKIKQPFAIGQKLKQKNGTEEYELVGYKGDLMLIKPLNESALYGYDTINPKIITQLKKRGFNPSDDHKQLHYMYADRFEKI